MSLRVEDESGGESDDPAPSPARSSPPRPQGPRGMPEVVWEGQAATVNVLDVLDVEVEGEQHIAPSAPIPTAQTKPEPPQVRDVPSRAGRGTRRPPSSVASRAPRGRGSSRGSSAVRKPTKKEPKPTTEEPPVKKKRRKKRLVINLFNCKYEVVRRVSTKLGMRVATDEEEPWHLFWTDTSVSMERAAMMKPFQRINHFPGMIELSRKDTLARNLNRMVRQYPTEYEFFPRSWILPADSGDLMEFLRQRKRDGKKGRPTFIVKPDSGCQGRGIYLTKDPTDIAIDEHVVVQLYVARPFLIDQLKFDLRVYVLVTSCDPLKVFLYEEGLARFCTEEYNPKEITNPLSQLTNYAIQKHSEKFEANTGTDAMDVGSKRSITAVNRWLRENGHDVPALWNSVGDMIVKTLLAAQPTLAHIFNTCFPNDVERAACFEVSGCDLLPQEQILGFDFLLDSKLRPWLLEVNHSPSFSCDSPLDKFIKSSLLRDTLVLLNVANTTARKRMEAEEKVCWLGCVPSTQDRVRQRLFRVSGRRDVRDEEAETNRRAELAAERETWESEHMGRFSLIYPNAARRERIGHITSDLPSRFGETTASVARRQAIQERRKLEQERLQKEAEKNMVVRDRRRREVVVKPVEPVVVADSETKEKVELVVEEAKVEEMKVEEMKVEEMKVEDVLKVEEMKIEDPPEPTPSQEKVEEVALPEKPPVPPVPRSFIAEPIDDAEERERLRLMALRARLVASVSLLSHHFSSRESGLKQRLASALADSQNASALAARAARAAARQARLESSFEARVAPPQPWGQNVVPARVSPPSAQSQSFQSLARPPIRPVRGAVVTTSRPHAPSKAGRNHVDAVVTPAVVEATELVGNQPSLVVSGVPARRRPVGAAGMTLPGSSSWSSGSRSRTVAPPRRQRLWP